MQASGYLGELGGLSAHHQLMLFDLRGTGASETPVDPESYRCDRLVDDLEALRRHLGVDQVRLLAHSAGANLAVLYAARHPERVDSLVLVTPSSFAVGLEISSRHRRELVELRRAEPWYAEAALAFAAVAAGRAGAVDWEAITPFTYGRWDDAARAHHELGEAQRNDEAAAIFGSPGAYDPPRARAALSTLQAPVLIVAGEVDVGAPPRVMADYADLFPHGSLRIQPGAGHFPWLDDPEAFRSSVDTFLARRG